jgi:RNA polymerase sigma factor (sigma-70 family)
VRRIMQASGALRLRTGNGEIGMEGVVDGMDRSASGFSALLERHRAIVFRVANSWCRHPDDRADLVQEIAAQLWRAWPAYDAQRSFTTWMYRIALNVAIASVRGERRRPTAVPLDEVLHDLVADADAGHENEQHLRQLQDFIARQAPLERALLLLYLEERSQREIGEILGLSETNVSTRIGRLKQRIRNEL